MGARKKVRGVLNGALFGSVSIGSFENTFSPKDIEVMELFKSADFKIKKIADSRSWLLSHFVMVAAMHLESLKLNTGSTSLKGVQNSEFWRNAILNGKELLPLLKARNVGISKSSELRMFNLPLCFSIV